MLVSGVAARLLSVVYRDWREEWNVRMSKENKTDDDESAGSEGGHDGKVEAGAL